MKREDLTPDDLGEILKFEELLRRRAAGMNPSEAYASVYGGTVTLYDASIPYVPGSIKMSR
jgi:hypothetical protein